MRNLNQLMPPRMVAVVLFAITACMPAVQAQKVAKPAAVKIGYFNLMAAKAACPEAAAAEASKTQGESQLRQDLADANTKIQALQQAKKPTDEIQKAVQEGQTTINAKQQALAQLVQAQNATAREKILQAVNEVARKENLDLVFDGASLYSGGQMVLDNGVDITNEITKKLNPNMVQDTGSKK